MKGRLIVGIIFIFIGVGYFLQAAGIIQNFGTIFGNYWPIILIIIGGNSLTKRDSSKTGNIILILIGIFLLLNNLNMIDNISKFFWPSIIILIGLKIIFSFPSKHAEISGTNDEFADIFTAFGGSSYKNISDNFKGGNVLALFGGSDLDITNAKISLDGACIELTVIFGGINLFVPENCKVIANGFPLFGGFDNKTNLEVGNAPVLKIKYFVAFGGIDIKDHRDAK